jgi:prophage antirepressor-like protein
VAERLDGDELTRIKFMSGEQTGEMYVVCEGGLYSVILRPDKPEAKAFKLRVTAGLSPA